MSEFTLSERDKQMFADLRRHHLRHPGSVSGRVVKILSKETLTPSHLAAARLEWLQLGLDKTKCQP